MTIDRILRSVTTHGAWLAGMTLFLEVGCAQPGPIASHRATVGSLKASVSQLEYANENLRKQVASLQTDASRADNELLQANNARDEMAARLDDAKNVIRNQNGDLTALNEPSGSSRASKASADDSIPPPARSPVRRSRSSRKPPAAQLPQIFDKARSTNDDSADAGPQASSFLDDGRWLPVARGDRSRGGSVEIR